MTLLNEHRLNPNGGTEADALIEEARQRQRKRRWFIGSIALIVLAVGTGVWAASGGGPVGKPTPSLKQSTSSKSPTAPGTRRGASSLPIAFDGKYGISPPAFPTVSEGIVDIGGFPGGNGPTVTWLERTTDGGRTWSIEPNFDQSSVAFNSATDGWLYGGELYKTTDAGLTWHRVPVTGLVGAVVTHGRYTWIDEHPKATANSNLGCEPTLLLRSTNFGANPRSVPVQPSLGGYCSAQFVATTGLSAYVLFAKRSGAARLAATDNGGHSWAIRSVPCAGQVVVIGTEPSLLQVCPYGPLLSMPGVSRVRLFRSTDDGRTWSRTFNGGLLDSNGSLVQSSSLVSWSWTEYLYGREPGAVQRTDDGGLHWRTIFPNGAIHASPRLGPVSFTEPLALVVHSPLSASLVIEVYGKPAATSIPTHFLLGKTTNGGSTWTWSYLVNEKKPSR
jgi:hypothetical protein